MSSNARVNEASPRNHTPASIWSALFAAPRLVLALVMPSNQKVQSPLASLVKANG